MAASSSAVVNLLEPNSPEKQKPAEGRALHPVEPGNLDLWQDRAFPTSHPAVKR
jgi:hypothetical protein